MLGPLELRLPGKTLGPRDLGGIKPKQLLEILLLDRGRTVVKDRLADGLWGEDLPQRVDATIETYVSVLRKRLDSDSGLGRRLIATEHGGYRIASELVETDLEEFESLLAQARSQEAAERRAALTAATALSEEELLADEPYAEWAIPHREHNRARRLQALIDLADCCLELGDLEGAITAADGALAMEPVSERAYRAKMLGQYALGARDEALRTHARCREVLAEQLGIDPTPELSDLHVAILRDEDPAALLGGGELPDVPGNLRPPLPVGFASGESGRIAYQVIGEGPTDLVFIPSFITDLRASWEDPTYATFLRRLAEISRLILFDTRGTGLSDPVLDYPSTEERASDLRAVLDAAGSESPVLFGACAGGALCAQFAADNPHRASGLILHNFYARMLACEDYPWGWPAERYESFLARFEEAWLSQDEGIARRNPGLVENPRYRSWFGRYVMLAANPHMARRLAERNAEIDVRPLLDRIEASCLVMCRTEDVWFSPENSRYLAAHLPDAELLELEGVDHDPWVGDIEPVLNAVETFVARVGEASPSPARLPAPG